MAQNTKIEWTEATWNFIVGCDKISPGCKNCYAITEAWIRAHNPNEKVSRKFLPTVKKENGKANWTGEITFSEDALLAPLRRRKPTKYFVNSMSDLFHENVKDEWIDAAFSVMALTPQHTYQILTKRPERMREYVNTCFDGEIWNCLRYLNQLGYDYGANISHWTEYGQHFIDFKKWPIPNVFLGVSVEDQKTADERIPHLLQTPAAVRFLSVEPMLGTVNLRNSYDPRFGGVRDFLRGIDTKLHCNLPGKIDWVIVGTESGPNRRPAKIEWVENIVGQCQAAGVPVFVKQIELNGKVEKDIERFPKHLQIREFPEAK